MTIIMILAATLIGLFLSAFFSRRRFGILGLGLVAGAVISPIWGETAGLMLSATGLVPAGPLVALTAAGVLIILPAFLLMFHGYTYKGMLGRSVGAVMFTVLAAAFLIGPVGEVVVFTGPAAIAYDWLVVNRELIISVGVALSVFDILIAKPSRKGERRRR